MYDMYFSVEYSKNLIFEIIEKHFYFRTKNENCVKRNILVLVSYMRNILDLGTFPPNLKFQKLFLGNFANLKFEKQSWDQESAQGRYDRKNPNRSDHIFSRAGWTEPITFNFRAKIVRTESTIKTCSGAESALPPLSETYEKY